MFKIYSIIIFVVLISHPILISQQLDELNNHTLIIGELSGKVDHNDITNLLKTDYYPISRTPNKTPFRVVKNSPLEVIIEYIDNFPYQPRKILFRFFSSEMTLVASIITDEIDFFKTESVKMAEEVHKSNPTIRVIFQNKPNNLVKMIAYNCRHAIFRNKNVRNALSYAVNKQYILSKLLDSRANIASGPAQPKSSPCLIISVFLVFEVEVG